MVAQFVNNCNQTLLFSQKLADTLSFHFGKYMINLPAVETHYFSVKLESRF